MPSLWLSAPFADPPHRSWVADITRLGNRSLFLSRHGPRKDEPLFADGRFDALAPCLIQDLRIREGRVVGTSSALEVEDPREGLVVHRSEPGEVLHNESPRRTLRTERVMRVSRLLSQCGDMAEVALSKRL